MTINLSDAARLIRIAQLEDIRLVETHAETVLPFGVEIEEVAADINFGGIPIPQSAKDTIVTRARVNVAVRPAESSESLVTVEAVFELRYTIPPDAAPTADELTAFAGSNAVFHAWPYWREFVQSTFVRMGLPPVLLPTFRLENIGKRLKGKSAEKRTRNVPDPEHVPSQREERRAP